MTLGRRNNLGLVRFCSQLVALEVVAWTIAVTSFLKQAKVWLSLPYLVAQNVQCFTIDRIGGFFSFECQAYTRQRNPVELFYLPNPKAECPKGDAVPMNFPIAKLPNSRLIHETGEDQKTRL
jgi:hypothetical protein